MGGEAGDLARVAPFVVVPDVEHDRAVRDPVDDAGLGAADEVAGGRLGGVDVVELAPDGGVEGERSQLRRAGIAAAVLAVTADRDLRAVKGAVGAGVADHLLEPFTAALLAQKLERVAAAAAQSSVAVTQARIDQAFGALTAQEAMQKGLQHVTLDLVQRVLRQGGPSSAGEVADRAAISRPTAHRYLEYLAATGEADRVPRYGPPGRPELGYRLCG